jgi:hypothetical protein
MNPDQETAFEQMRLVISQVTRAFQGKLQKFQEEAKEDLPLSGPKASKKR